MLNFCIYNSGVSVDFMCFESSNETVNFYGQRTLGLYLNPHSAVEPCLGDLGPVAYSAYPTSEGCYEDKIEERRIA